MRGGGPREPETERTVSGAVPSGRDISGASHARVLFLDLDLTEVEEEGASFEECVFRRVRFNASVHRRAAFVNCWFAGCSFYDARFTDCKLVGSRFERCGFEVMQVSGGNWSFVGLAGADLHSASFRGLVMREAELVGADLHGATLRDVDLSGAWLDRANLAGCDLRGSDLSAVDPLRVELRGAIISIDQTIVMAQGLGLDVRLEEE